jgi:hypothetical protein
MQLKFVLFHKAETYYGLIGKGAQKNNRNEF